MKKLFTVLLAAGMLMGLMTGCIKQGPTDAPPNTPGTSTAKELISQVHYTSTYDRNGEKSENELSMKLQWTEDGAVMEGYETSSEGRTEVRMEAKLDDQKRPLSLDRTITRPDGEIQKTKVEFSYPSALQVKQVVTRESENTDSRETVYEYNAKGELIREITEDYTKGYEYNTYGQRTRVWLDSEDDIISDWEETTVYTYDENQVTTYSVTTRGDTETQTHYYYYPNGSVMFELEVTSTGDVNYNFRPYNTKDYLTWSYGKVASGGMEYEVEKNSDGYITKVIRKWEHGDAQTATFEYDDKGNLVKQKTGYGTIYTWEYDAQNRPVKRLEENPDTVDQNVYTTVYEYDAEGRLVAEKMTGTNGASYSTAWTYNEVGMTICKEEKRVSIYVDETVTQEKKMEIQYVENSNCAVDPMWAEFYLKNLISGIG